MWEFEIGKNMRLFRTTAEQAQQPRRDTFEQDRLADDQRDCHERIDFHVAQVHVLQPAREVMENEEEVARDQHGIDAQLEEERAQSPGGFNFHAGTGRRITLSSLLAALPVARKLRSKRKFHCARGLSSYLPLRFYGRPMADAANKYPENVDGKFYVDDQCIDCDLCRETAPANYKRNDDGGHSFVYKQPESPEEEALCKEAMEGCPVEAIGNDGA